MTEGLPQQTERMPLSPEDQRALGSLPINAMLRENDSAEQHDVQMDVAETANYQGNWMVAQSERMADPDFKTKFDNLVQDNLPHLRDGEPSMLDKPDQFKSYYQELGDSIDERSEHVYSAVGYAPASQFNQSPHRTGLGGIGERGTVFSDATTMDGTPLTDRQKDIIAAHEAYHGMVKAPGPAQKEIMAGFDNEVYYGEIVDTEGLKQPGYLQNPDELMARMAQLKNYFGMKGGEAFTKQHLDYARAHYVEDTGLDNSMSTMMRMVSSRTEADFLRLMNTLPV